MKSYERGREGKIKQDETREEEKPERLLTLGNELRVAGWGAGVTG